MMYFILFALGIIVGIIISTIFLFKKSITRKQNEEKLVFSLRYNISILTSWCILSSDGNRIGDYFEKNKISNIVIYGMGYMGQWLCEELINRNINVIAAIDRNIVQYKKLKIIKIEEEKIPECDYIIVTPVVEMEKIKEDLDRIAPNIKAITIKELIDLARLDEI